MSQEFIASFFGTGNALSLTQRNSDGQTYSERLEPWLARLRNNPPQPAVLPRLHADGEVDWYGLAQSEKDLRVLSEDLSGFVGPTYSDFNGQRAHMNSSDPIEAAVLAFTCGHVFKFRGQSGADGRRAVWAALDLMDRVTSRKPMGVSREIRSTSWVLRNLYMALQAGNRSSAENNLDYLAVNARLDTLNLLFLRVQILFELGLWTELRALPQWNDLLQVRRPADVTQALLTALYRCELTQFEDTRDAAGALAYFQSNVRTQHAPLFLGRGGRHSPEILKSFMLLATAEQPPHKQIQDELIAQQGISAPDLEYLRAIAVLRDTPTPSAPPTDFLRLAVDADLAGDLDSVLNYAQQAQASPQRTRLLFRCAMEIGTLEVERAAVEALHAMDGAARTAYLQQRFNRDLYERIVGQHAANAPSTWLDWLERLKQEEHWDRALDVARQGSLEWDVQPLLDVPNVSQRLFELLTAERSQDAQNQLQEALPFLLRFFLRDEGLPRQEFAGLYANLLDLLVFQTDCGADDLELFNDLFRTQSGQGMSAKRYIELLDYASDFWNRTGSAVKLDWALDFIDLLLGEPCLDQSKRQQFFYDVVGSIKKFERRVGTSQWSMLDLLCADLGEPPVARTITVKGDKDDSHEEPAAQTLGCKLMGLYTLTESVGRRAKQLIEGQYSGMEVRVNSDSGGTEPLKQLAQHADIFIVVTQSAKHAATLFIEKHLPKSTPLLRPAGKGISSILRSLRELVDKKQKLHNVNLTS